MKPSSYTNYDVLPLFLNVEIVGSVLDTSPSNRYKLMHEIDFPILKVGSQMVVSK